MYIYIYIYNNVKYIDVAYKILIKLPDNYIYPEKANFLSVQYQLGALILKPEANIITNNNAVSQH